MLNPKNKSTWQKKQRIEIKHRTSYFFDQMTTIMPHVIRLRPAPHCSAPLESYQLIVEPENHTISWQQDPFSNHLARLFFPEKSQKLIFSVNIIAEIININPFDFFIEDHAQHFPFEYEQPLKDGLSPYLKTIDAGPELKSWLENIQRTPQPTIDFLVTLNKQLYHHLEYSERYEEGVQSCEETLSNKIGSCRDSAWLLIQIFRHQGLAARFVSGYAIKLEDKGDSVDLHAWVEVYIPGAGWIGLDPTSGLFAAGTYIPLACTPEPSSAAPITGATSPCKVTFEYTSTVTRL